MAWTFPTDLLDWYYYLFLGDNDNHFIIRKMEIARKLAETRTEVSRSLFILVSWLV